MNLASFMNLVELRTKLASILPFIFGSLYALYTFDTFDLSVAMIMFCSMLLFDMTTTALNNYMDHKKALLREGYGYEVHNAITRYKLNIKLVKYIILFMLFAASLLGLYLVYLTNTIVLILGMICFAIGISYSYGPLPISRTPFGELFSGIAMGFLLPFISIYIHIFNSDVLNIQIQANQSFIRFNLDALSGIFMVCVPFILTIAHIMLANNLCDMEEDLPNQRYTLPIYIGKENALKLWELGYYIVYFFIIVAVITQYLPWICLLTLITFVPVKHNIDYFKLKQVKSETFSYAIRNFLIIGGSLILTLALQLFVSQYLF